MPVYRKKYDMESAEDFTFDIACVSRAHDKRFIKAEKMNIGPQETKEKVNKEKETKEYGS